LRQGGTSRHTVDANELRTKTLPAGIMLIQNVYHTNPKFCPLVGYVRAGKGTEFTVTNILTKSRQQAEFKIDAECVNSA